MFQEQSRGPMNARICLRSCNAKLDTETSQQLNQQVRRCDAMSRTELAHLGTAQEKKHEKHPTNLLAHHPRRRPFLPLPSALRALRARTLAFLVARVPEVARLRGGRVRGGCGAAAGRARALGAAWAEEGEQRAKVHASPPAQQHLPRRTPHSCPTTRQQRRADSAAAAINGSVIAIHGSTVTINGCAVAINGGGGASASASEIAPRGWTGTASVTWLRLSLRLVVRTPYVGIGQLVGSA
eukprot:308547-Rhodomonas_salina.2